MFNKNKKNRKYTDGRYRRNTIVVVEGIWRAAGRRIAPLTHALRTALPWSRAIDASWDAPGITFNIYPQGSLYPLASARLTII